MEDATIYRALSKHAFVVQLLGFPGVVEVHCRDVSLVGVDRVDFDRLTKRISPLDEKSLLRVSLRVGKYCLGRRAFVDCDLLYTAGTSAAWVSDWCPVVQPIVSPMASNLLPVPKKRSFIRISQTM
jgi:hypothetical protein